MSKLSVLEQKIADIRAQRDAAALQVKMFDQVLELLEAPVKNADPERPAVPRAPRGHVQQAVLFRLADAPMTIADLERNIDGTARSSIRKALAALMKDGKVAELNDGTWKLKPVEPVVIEHEHARTEMAGRTFAD